MDITDIAMQTCVGPQSKFASPTSVLHAAAFEPLVLTFQLADVGLVKDYQSGDEHMQKRLRITGGCRPPGSIRQAPG
jgi:hypothetical protein